MESFQPTQRIGPVVHDLNPVRFGGKIPLPPSTYYRSCPRHATRDLFFDALIIRRSWRRGARKKSNSSFIGQSFNINVSKVIWVPLK